MTVLKRYLATAILILVLLPNLALAAEIGQLCQSDADCPSADFMTGNCEESSKVGGNGKHLFYCACKTKLTQEYGIRDAVNFITSPLTKDDLLAKPKSAECAKKYGAPADGGSWVCIDGSRGTNDLNYCLSTNGKSLEPPLPITNKTSLLDAIFDTRSLQVGLVNEALANKPTLEIRIPTIDFSKTVVSTTDEEGNTYLMLPWIGEYIAGLYQYGLIAVSIVAVAMLIRQGFNAILGGEFAQGSFKRIPQIIAGLLLMWGSYFLLNYINPALVSFKVLKVFYMQGRPLPEGNYGAGMVNPGAGAVLTPAEYKPILDNISKNFGLDSCVFGIQIGMESGWNTGVKNTSCCYGLGQVYWDNARVILNDSTQRQKLIDSHINKQCPTCPPAGTQDKQTISSWLVRDVESNLIVTAMVKSKTVNGQTTIRGPNPIAAAAIYGVGQGTYNDYLKKSNCTPIQFSQVDLKNKLTEYRNNIPGLIQASCVPPDTWPSANSAKNLDCPGTTQCCAAPSGDCQVPAFTDLGRIGVCRGGAKDGQRCATSPMTKYIGTYINSLIKSCAGS